MVQPCIGYVARPFVKMRREQRFSIVLCSTFLKVYASIIDFLQSYASNLSKSSSFIFQFLSAREVKYCNIMRPAGRKRSGNNDNLVPVTFPVKAVIPHTQKSLKPLVASLVLTPV
jgi:hypothetical protein